MRHALLAIAVLACLDGAARADEGMWTFEHPPARLIQSKHGFELTPAWLDHLRLSALSFGGASGSFVSPRGLALTNHHVALSCLQKLSSEKRDLVKDGYVAHARADELPCPGFEVRRLESTRDVTREVQAAVRSTDAAGANAERNGVIARIEDTCRRDTGLRCEVDTRFRGAAYVLLRYKVWTDVRLVFAPESSVGFFGGDADNFVYPRFDLDAALLRVYENGAPVAPRAFLRWSGKGVREGDLVFAAGHPYSTDRLTTLAQLAYERDIAFPLRIASAQRQRRDLQAFGARSPEGARRAGENLFGTENWLKAMLGEHKLLRDPALFDAKRRQETLLRTTPREEGARDPWMRIDAATRIQTAIAKESWSVAYGYRTLFDTAGRIVELANERALPESERLAEYRESSIERILTRLTADAPVYKDLEIARTAGYWQEARELLGDDHAFVREVLRGRTPHDAAAAVIEPSKLDRVEVRKALVDGGLAAVNAADDPLIALARRVYPLRRKVAKLDEVDVEEPIRQAADDIERLRFAALGADAYPDATGSLRLSFGIARGYDNDGLVTPWQTNYWGLFARHAAFEGKAPFDLPARWIERGRDLRLATPLDFVATLDIIGGNSGSPVVDRDGELVGVVFDSNLEGLGNRFGYTEQKARAIVVDARAIVEALLRVYGAPEVVDELLGR